MLKPYSQLTVAGQARRLRRLALNALVHYDLPVQRLRLVTNDFNGIFRVDAGGQKYILRVTLPEGGHNLDSVQAETAWLSALSRDTGLSVPRPLAARSGEYVVTAQAEGVPEPRMCILFTWVPGSDLADHLTDENLSKLGVLSAQLHAHAEHFDLPQELRIFRFDRVFPFPEPVILFEERFATLFPPERRQIFEQAIGRAQQAIERLQASGEPMRLTHGDLHCWNVRLARGVLSPIDFEDMMWAWPVQDIATTLYYTLSFENLAGMRRAFQSGYTSHSPWPERYPGEIDAFIAARAVGLVNFILQDPSPAWSKEAPEFVEKTEVRLRTLLAEKMF